MGDLLSALERIFCCPEGQLKLLGEPGQPGEKSHDFLGSGTTKNPDIVLTAVWLVETCRFSNNFGKF